jgi:RNA polymerase sigma-70 factor, ECF subfamily
MGTVAQTGATRSITSLLVDFAQGNREAESELAALVYEELRRLASAYMRRERRNHTLQPTALVNEIWGQLANQPNIAWQGRAHFFAIASCHMRRILVDRARARNAARRGGAQQQVALQDHLIAEEHNVIDVIALNEALEGLEALDPRACRIVELHFFGGLSFEEMALVLGVSTRTVKRDWSMARRWLRNELATSM